MKIQFLGHSSFLVTTNSGKRVVTDPFDTSGLGYAKFDGSAEYVTVSHDHADHGTVSMVSGNPRVIRGVDSVTVDGVRFRGVATSHDSSGGAQRGSNTVFIIEADGLRVAHMGDLGHLLTDEQVGEIGPVDVLLVPVGGYYTIDAATAHQTAVALQARIVIPMHYKNSKCRFPIAGVDEFIAGGSDVRQPGVSVLEVSCESLPKQMQIVVLEPSL